MPQPQNGRGALGACAVETIEAKSRLREDRFSTIRRPIAVAMGQEAAEIWTAQTALQTGRLLPRRLLAAGGLAALLASTCCLGPLVLVTLGFSGAWIGNLTVLEPYRPILIGAALIALFFAWRSIFRPLQACEPGDVCAVPRVRTAYKIVFWIVAALVTVALAFPYVLPLFY